MRGAVLRRGIGTERCHGSADFAGGGSEDRVVATSRYFLENDVGARCLGELRTHSDRDDLVVATMKDIRATLPRDQLLELSLVVEAMGDQKAERDAECDYFVQDDMGVESRSTDFGKRRALRRL